MNFSLLSLASVQVLGVTSNAALRTVLVYSMDEASHRRAAADINQAIEEGALQALIAARYPLRETAAAHDAVDSGDLIGKVIVHPDRVSSLQSANQSS